MKPKMTRCGNWIQVSDRAEQANSNLGLAVVYGDVPVLQGSLSSVYLLVFGGRNVSTGRLV